ncbi:MAG: hypothetical protein HOQ07_05310 [Sinomonas sp.]|nr:hypothetical protein [Sinomonas sp.]
MTTTNTSPTPSDAADRTPVRVPDAHAVEARATMPEPTPHALRPAPRRAVRRAHGEGAPSAGLSASSASLRLDRGPLLPPTPIPDHSGDLLGLPDFEGLRRALARAWAWLRESFEAAGAVEARLRARRDDDAVRLTRYGASPTRLI